MIGREHVVHAVGQRLDAACRPYLQEAGVLDNRAVAERDSLTKAAVLSGRLDAVGLQRGFDIVERAVIAGGAQTAPFELVVGQRAHVLPDQIARNHAERRPHA